jgi:hypothetical protein
MAIGRITGQMLSSQLNRNTTDLKFSTTGETNLLVLDASNDRIGIGTASPTVQFETTGSAIIGTDLTVTGNLTVNGSTTTINTTNLTVDDKNIELAHSLSGQAPTDAAADGGGIILKGDTDHTILWSNANNSWDFSENVSVATGSAFQINNSNVLDANNLTLENIQIAGNVITSASNADISLQPSGTGKVVIEGIQIDGTVITGVDSTVISFGGNKLSGVGEPTGESDVATKSYVDSQVGSANTLTLGDDASNSASVNLNSGENLKFKSGNSMTLSVSGNTVTSALNDRITVDEIAAKDSSAVSIQSPTQLDSTLQVAGTSSLVGDTTIANDITISSGSITSTSGTINFGNEILTTTGDVNANDITLSGNIDMTANASITIGSGDSTSDFIVNFDGTDAYITKSATSGETYIRSRNFSIQNNDGTQTFITGGHGGATELYHGGVAGPALTTTVSGGISIPNGTLLVNVIASGDSTSVRIDDSLGVDGSLDVGGTFTIANGQGITAILDEDNFASDSATALATQQSIKAYVDSQVSASNTLTIGDDGSTEISLNLDDVLNVKGGNSITSSVAGDSLTFALDDRITVDEIAAKDSSAVSVQSPLQLDSTLQVAGIGTIGSIQISGNVISSTDSSQINFGQHQLTDVADPTQASDVATKSYVDSQTSSIVTQIGISDSASNRSDLTLGTNDLEFRQGDSITPTVAGTGVTFNLNDNITVNQIGAKDSTAVSITSNTQVDGTLQVSGASTLVGNVSSSGSVTAGTSFIIGGADLNETDLEKLDGITDGTGAANKALVLDASQDITSGVNVFTATTGDFQTVKVNTIESDDSTAVTVNDGLQVNGNFGFNEGVTVTQILDEDNFSSNSATALATQQSIKAYVDAVAEGLHVHASVKAATTQTLALESGDTVTYDNGSSGVGATLTLSTGISTLDGYTLVDGDRILIKNESNTSHNGIYIRTSSTVLTRATDFDTSAEIQGGDFFFVTLGTLNGSNGYVQTEISISVGSTAIIFSQFSGAGQITAGDGMTKTGNTLDVNVDDSTIEINSDTLRVKDAGITNVKLAKSTITVVGDDSTGTAVSLGETFKIAGGESLNASVSADTLTINLDDDITVNQIGAKDSTAVSITSPVQVTGALNTDTSLQIAGSTLVDGILDEDNMASNSATKLATQQSIKAYVDSVAGGTITLGDSASNSGSVNINAGQDLEFRSGDSLTLTVLGNGVTAALNDNITVNQIGAKDSTAVSITSALQTTSIQSSGAVTVNGTFTIGTGSGVTTILDEDTLSSDSDTALATQQSIKAYVDSQITASNTLTLGDDASSEISLNLDDVLNVKGGNSITSSVAGDSLTFALDSNISVNQIGALDSTAINITSPVYVSGALNTDTSLQIAGSTLIDGILDEDNMVSNSATKLATQQSIKAYVDSVAGGTITLGDSASNTGSVDINAGQDLEFRAGNSITPTVSGNGVTIALDNNIVVDAISSASSTFVRINDSLETEAAQINSTLTVDGDAQIKGNLTVQGTTTYIETTNTKISDPLLLLNNGNSGGADIDSGIMIERGSAGNNAVLYWNEGDDRFKAVLTTAGQEATTVSDDSYATLNVGGLVMGSESVVITSILDEDNFASDSATALATQQSIKAYVDSVAGGTITLGDSASNAGSVNINAGQDLEFRSGDSITMTVSGNGVTAALNDDITVNQIGAKDSTAVSITSALQTTSIQSSGNVNVNGTFTIGTGSGVTTILDEDTLSSDSDTALATQQSIKAYVDSQVAASNTLTLGDDASSEISLNLDDVLNVKGGNSITSSVAGDSLTFALDANITVNQIGALDSTAINITSPVYVSGALNTDTSLVIAGSTLIDGILDEDNMASDSATKLATQQSIKAYVDSVAGGTITLGDSASNSGSVDINAGQDLEFRAGNSITPTVSGNGVTIALDNNIVVDAISSASSTFVRINDSLETEAAQINSTLTVDGDAQIKGNLTVQGTTTYIETTNTKISDPILLLNNGNSGEVDIDSGIMIERGSARNNAVLYWNEGDDRFKAVLTTAGQEATTVSDDSYATLNVGGLVMSAESVVITSILDEDNFASNSDTALATQQSIKAYVDSVAGGTITLGDSASNAGSVDINGGQDLEFRSGDSITLTVSGNGVTAALNDDITVNQIGAKDSSAVSITSPLQTSTIQASGNITVNGGTVSAGSGSTFGDLTLSDGSITDASGTIDFGDENLTLTGNITATGGTITANQFDVGTLSITDGQITDSDGTIGFNDINLDGIDTLTASTIDTNIIQSTNSTKVNVQDSLEVDGSLDVGSNFTISNGTSINAILDEDNFASDSATALATQQSIKAYVDTQISASSVASLNDIGDVDAASGNKLDGDILVVNDDSSNVFTLSSQLTTGMRLPTGTTAQRPPIYSGVIRYNTETGLYEGSTDGSTWSAFAMAGNAETLTKDVFTGDGGATYNWSNITDPTSGDGNNGALGLIVYIDNVLQEPTQNYTISPTAITFDSVVHSGARIVVIQGFDGGAGGAGGGAGFTTITNSDVDSAVENIDTFAVTTYRAAHYHYVIENDDISEFQTGQIHVLHDGTSAQITEFGITRTGNNDLITFSVDISGSDFRLRGSAQAPNSKIKLKRVHLEVQ